MAWQLKGNPKTVRISQKLAEQYANAEPCPDDRPLSEMRMRVYEKLMKEGSFRPMTWALAFCKEIGTTYRVNGKHTATLAARLDPLPELYATLEFYECEDLRDVARLYSTFDSKMQSRTVTDINHSFASCVPQLAAVESRTINLTPPAVAYARLQDRYRDLQPQERAEALLDHWDFAVWASELVGRNNTTHGHMKRMPVYAAMFATRQKHPKLAEDFWLAVRDESGPKPDLPDRKLARFLITHGMLLRDKDRRHRFIVSEREFFVKSLHAWNAWRRASRRT